MCMKLSTLLALGFAVVYSDDCPPFGDWLPWTDKCLWLPLKKMRDDIAAACQTTFVKSREGASFPMMENLTLPSACGHCAFKFRCRKRDKKEGCYSLDPQRETCHEFSETCEIPKHPKIGCKYHLVSAAAKNCINRHDLPEWRRDSLKKFAAGLPESNCIEADGKCHCCCHPYTPSNDGKTCVQQTVKTDCAPFSEFTPWSQCLWFPLADISKDIKEHCQLQDYIKTELPTNILALPAGFKIPEKCGYCSFKTRCRKREKIEGCFSVDAEKKVCGTEDCPSCGEICTVQKLNNTCDWGGMFGRSLLSKAEAFSGTLPYWRRRGMQNLMRHIPYGICKEVGDQCKCCCHPYEPNEDGTKCVLTPMCSFDVQH